MKLEFLVYNINEKRYLNTTELMKFVMAIGQEIDDYGHAEYGAITIEDKEGYRIEPVQSKL